jgi:alpha-L-rhamnosidase
VLEEGGRLDVAYKLLEQETFPSWLFPVKNGATTIWERWDGWTPEKGFQDKGMNSFNHYAYGAVGAWMYKSAAGLDLDSEEPGYQHILFRPRPGGSLTWAEASLQTPFGEAAIHWEIVEKSLRLTLKVPKGARATLLPPPGWASEKKSLEPGQHVILLSRDQPNP